MWKSQSYPDLCVVFQKENRQPMLAVILRSIILKKSRFFCSFSQSRTCQVTCEGFWRAYMLYKHLYWNVVTGIPTAHWRLLIHDAIFRFKIPFNWRYTRTTSCRFSCCCFELLRCQKTRGFWKKMGAVWRCRDFFGGPGGDQMWPPPPFKHQGIISNPENPPRITIGCWRDIFGRQSFVSLENRWLGGIPRWNRQLSAAIMSIA